jgi:NAD(P)H-nitrite reductase large subunit
MVHMHSREVVVKNERVRPATFSPYLHGGVVSVEELQAMVESMRSSGAKNVKLTGEIVFVWPGADLPHGVRENGRWLPNNFKASCVRPVRICSAQTFCQRFEQPVLDLAREIDARFRNTPLPMKMVIGIAGCQRSCSEPATKDIGIIGHPKGYMMLVGGAAGMEPRIGAQLGVVRKKGDVLEVIARIIALLGEEDKKSRIGKMIGKIGVDEFKRRARIDGFFTGGTEE